MTDKFDPAEYLISDRPNCYMHDTEVLKALDEYGDYTFDQLPDWLRCELQSRGWHLKIPNRAPTKMEIIETEQDAFEHRVMNNECTITDIHNHFTNWKRIKRNG